MGNIKKQKANFIKLVNGKTTGKPIHLKDVPLQNKAEKKEFINSEERYRTLLATSPDAIVLANLRGYILMSNKKFVDIIGFENIESSYGENIFNYISYDDKKRIFNDAKIAFEVGIIENKEYQIKKRDGTYFPVEISMSAVYDNFGRPEAIIAVIRDISKRKEWEDSLRTSELQFRSVWENSFDGMRLTDQKGIVKAVNKSFIEMVGLPEEELVGKSYNLIYLDDSNFNLDLNKFQEIFETRKSSKEYRAKFKSGKEVDIRVSYSILELDSGQPLLLEIFHDITEHKQVEKNLRESEKFATIGRMATYISHEIKTPLASIKMNIEMLKNKLHLSKKKEKSFTIIQKEISKLDKLLKDTLNFSRQTNVVPIDVNLYNVVDYTKTLFEPELNNKNIELINDIDEVFIKGDYYKLHTVFSHLIDNSIGSIANDGTIKVYSDKTVDTDKCVIYIEDNGTGIREPDKIFEPFYTSKSTGTGLGLPIVKKIMDLHNGNVELLSSKPGKTVFKLTFTNKQIYNE